jgi:hypothetical protein
MQLHYVLRVATRSYCWFVLVGNAWGAAGPPLHRHKSANQPRTVVLSIGCGLWPRQSFQNPTLFTLSCRAHMATCEGGNFIPSRCFSLAHETKYSRELGIHHTDPDKLGCPLYAAFLLDRSPDKNNPICCKVTKLLSANNCGEPNVRDQIPLPLLQI